jgi:hypothetical protein
MTPLDCLIDQASSIPPPITIANICGVPRRADTNAHPSENARALHTQLSSWIRPVSDPRPDARRRGSPAGSVKRKARCAVPITCGWLSRRRRTASCDEWSCPARCCHRCHASHSTASPSSPNAASRRRADGGPAPNVMIPRRSCRQGHHDRGACASRRCGRVRARRIPLSGRGNRRGHRTMRRPRRTSCTRRWPPATLSCWCWTMWTMPRRRRTSCRARTGTGYCSPDHPHWTRCPTCATYRLPR